MYEKLVSHILSSFCEKCFFSCCLVYLLEKSGLHRCTANHISSPWEVLIYREGVLYCSARLRDRVSHSGLLFKLKPISVGGSVLSICKEFLSNLRQRVVVDGATSEWIPIVFGVPQGSVLGPLLFSLYDSQMIELVENRLYTCLCWWPHYWQLFASQQTDLLLLPPLAGTWLGFRSDTES